MLKPESIRTAAQASWIAPLVSFAMNHFVHSSGNQKSTASVAIIILVLSLFFYLVGLGSGIVALAGIKLAGRKGVLIPASIGVLLNLVLLSMFLLLGSKQVFKPTGQQYMANLCSEVNKTCPKMIDEETRLDGLTPSGENTLVYKCTLVKIEKAALDLNKAKVALQELVNDNAKKNRECQELIHNGIRPKFAFYDKNNEFLCDAVVSK